MKERKSERGRERSRKGEIEKESALAGDRRGKN